jgi:hypothetical protein
MEIYARRQALLPKMQRTKTMTNHPEAALRALAEHGLRCDMNPTHDMSSLDASEEFWHRYLRMLDANVRQLATNALRGRTFPA